MKTPGIPFFSKGKIQNDPNKFSHRNFDEYSKRIACIEDELITLRE